MMSDAQVYMLGIVMLREYCRLAGLDLEETTQRLLDSDYTMGTQGGEHTIVRSSCLSAFLDVKVDIEPECYVVIS